MLILKALLSGCLIVFQIFRSYHKLHLKSQEVLQNCVIQ